MHVSASWALLQYTTVQYVTIKQLENLLWQLTVVLVAKYNAGMLKYNTSKGKVGRTQPCNHLQHDLVPLIKCLFNHLPFKHAYLL